MGQKDDNVVFSQK